MHGIKYQFYGLKYSVKVCDIVNTFVYQQAYIARVYSCLAICTQLANKCIYVLVVGVIEMYQYEYCIAGCVAGYHEILRQFLHSIKHHSSFKYLLKQSHTIYGTYKIANYPVASKW